MAKRRAPSGPDKVEQQMTPMIDIVFQLLTFFVMSFKIATEEGDFNVKMPIGVGQATNADQIQPVRVKLAALPDGQLREIKLGDRSLGRSMDDLQKQIAAVANDDLEVEFDCDYNLHYNNVINAISAVSGKLTPEGKTIRYVEKIKFTPPKAPQ
ncbi:MAG: biopolymer transporter ExbD [Planctomycetes bacterium]|nr:biopolymer transporter ExbD [Planctomycetota bacterium]